MQSTYERRFPRVPKRAGAEPLDTAAREPRDSRQAELLAKGLGIFSLGLGLLELAAPEKVARLIGVRADDDHKRALRAAGLREITSGIGILGQVDNRGWLWSRVGGDFMDLALLAGALKQPGAKRDRVLMAAAAVLGVTVLDVLASSKQPERIDDLGARDDSSRDLAPRALSAATRLLGAGHGSGIHVHQAITIKRPVDEVYRFWRNFSNLPRFMSHLESVTVLNEKRSHWKANGPGGTCVQWDAELTEDVVNQRIAWASLANADIENSGSVRFMSAPGGRGTEVHVALSYKPPAGKLGAVVAKLFGEEPSQQVKADLRHFKQMLEIGEITHSDASIHRGPHPGRPAQNSAALTRGA